MSERIKIIDYNHLVHKYINSPNIDRLFCTKTGTRGEQITVETTIMNYTTKEIHNIANRGIHPIGICFDSPCKFRKDYFSKKADGTPADIGYKAGRTGFSGGIYNEIERTQSVMWESQLSMYKMENYEADDLVFSLVEKCKRDFPNTPIDVYTNDQDLLPLVSEQVSVFIRNKRMTWAESKDMERKGYWQIRPYNYAEFCQGTSKMKKFDVPYNTVLLFKLLRGDESDNIPKQANPFTGKNEFPPKVYNELVSILENENIQTRLANGLLDTLPYCTGGFDETRNRILSCYNEETGYMDLGRVFRYGDSVQLDCICDILSLYLEQHDIEHIRYVYNGMNLRYLELYPIHKYNPITLLKNLQEYDINLPL